ncbi:hypothetical protein M408DRAFT_29287 [Serendipita vermifera MAFF 305830]|uniref:F-box domain-containing protein n=1 Tax=Serendipita vermifera MAFF 305830 TaxID=933852 RepID=A0A0C3ANY5_SERVB|nr:hypothetical protein M408DRAFT_29287 [Serendipita vermifera MAFF 305830]
MANPIKTQETATQSINDIGHKKQNIIQEIAGLEARSDGDETRMDRIRALREQYNLLVDEEEEKNTRRLVDPLQVLPPELWTEFLPQDASELLVLTLVCNQWRTTLLSVPILWTSIELDGTHDDYLCKAVTGLACSAPLEISLSIKLPLEEWRKIAPLIVGERSRIYSLDIRPFYDHNKGMEAFGILLDFGSLPKLTTLNLPRSHDYPTLFNSEPEVKDPEHGYPCDETFFAKVPLLSSFYGFTFLTEQLRIPGASNFKNVDIRILHSDTVLALQKFPRLNHLSLVEEKKPYDVVDQSLPASLHSSLLSVENFYYHGLFFHRALPCIGNNLHSLVITLITVKRLPELFMMLPSFPKLSDLILDVDQTATDPFVDYQAENIRLSPITSLHLKFPSNYLSHIDSEATQTRRKQALEHLFHSLVVMMPSVENLTIMGSTFEDVAVEYIQSLRKLQILVWATELDPTGKPPLILKTDCLDSVNWYGKVPYNGVFDIFASSTLRSLQFWPNPPTPEYDGTFEAIYTPFPRFKTPSHSMPNLTTLAINPEHRLVWDLSSFPQLKKLEFTGHPSAVLAADFFEELALQPNQCALLEEISLAGVYVEWDILILMLERRNLLSKPGITLIRSIKLYQHIAYKLLRPIVKLLGGKYPHRDSLEEYSSIAVGKLVWDKELPGCQKCCRAFQACSKKLETKPGSRIIRDYEDNVVYETDLRLGMDYPSSLELVPADLPLTAEVAEWLADKPARRRAFVKECKKANSEFNRPFTCGNSWDYLPSITFTQYSLDGVTFEDEME